jgi:flagellar assembly protein FliH
LSKVIKSFNNRTADNKENETDVVIGIQPVSIFTAPSSGLIEEDDESKIQRLKKEAAELLEEAESEAARIKAEAEMFLQETQQRLAAEEQEWRLKMEQELEMTKQEGYETGFQNGLNQGLENWRNKLDEVKRFIEKTKQDYYQVLSEAEPQMILLAIKAAEKIIGQKLEESPETWVSIVKQLVKEAREFEEVKLYVPIDWFDLTVQHREELKNMLQSTASLFIYPDESLKENGAVIEFPFGKIDATLDVQLKEIRDKLLEQIEVTENER